MTAPPRSERPATGIGGRDFLGHPRGLAVLFATESWERFSYFGNAALVVLYMVKYLLEPGRVEAVLGFGAVKAALEFLFGRLDPQPLASQIFGFYTGLAYFMPVFGGLIADRLLGQRRTVIIGGVLMAIGHFMMAFETLFLLALLMLILGIGAFKPNISTQVGALYPPADDSARPRLFDLLSRHQYRGVSGAAGLRHARGPIRMARGLRRRRRRNAGEVSASTLAAGARCRPMRCRGPRPSSLKRSRSTPASAAPCAP